jgi:YD repeat-containing protein
MYKGVNDYNLGCTNPQRPKLQGEADIIDGSTCLTNATASCGGTNVNWTGWSAIGTINSDYTNTCALYQAKEIQGVEISNFSVMKPTGLTLDAANNCVVPGSFTHLIAAKTRPLVCPAGYQGRTLPNGVIECWRFPSGICPECGNPIRPGDGSKIQRETDFRGAGPFPLVLERYYSSFPYYASVEGADRQVSGFDVFWVSNYDSRVFYDPVNTGIRATVQRANGVVKTFDTQGNEIGVTEGNERDHLDLLTGSGGAITGWRYTTATGDMVETFNASGLLVTRQNRAGLTQTLTYSDANTSPSIAPRAGLLLSVADHFGRTLTFHYDSSGRIDRITDPAGGEYAYLYDEHRNLIQVTYPDTGTGPRKTRQYLYNETAETGGANLPNHLTGIIDENASRYATYTYGTDGKAIASQHAGGVGKVTMTYGNGDATATYHVGEAASPLTTTRKYIFSRIDGKVKNTAIVDPNTNLPAPCPGCGSSGTTTYDANGFIASRIDFNGNLTCYTHDARGLETQRVEGLAGTSCPGTPTAVTRTVTTTWHATFHLPLTMAEPLRLTTHTYDTIGNLLTRSVQASTDASGAQGTGATAIGSPRITTYSYNSNGLVLTVNGPRTDVSDITTYTYYADNDPDIGKRGNIATVSNALSQTTQITAYNAVGQPLTIVDPNGLTTQLGYDGRQRLTSRTVGAELTSYIYDGVGQVTQITLPDSSTVSQTYDGAHRLTSVQDSLGNKITYTLDLMGNRVKEDVNDPSNQLAQTRSRVYDALNRLQKDIGAQSQTTQYAYDAQGNLVAATDPLNRVANSTYDALNRLATMTQPAALAGQPRPVVAYGYNGLDQLTQVTDPRNLATSYAYDGLGNLNQQISPDTGTTANTYDAAGNVLTSTDAKSQVTAYTYDALNRVATITYNQATGTQLKTVAYTYDQGTNGVGRLTTVTETAANGTTILQTSQYAYDQRGRLIQETRAFAGQSFVTAYAYDQTSGRLTGMTYPSGRTVSYSYDAIGRITQISSTASAAQGGQTQTLVSGVTYRPFGSVKSYTMGNNRAVTRGYDQDGRVSSYTLSGTAYTVGYDAASRITSLLDTSNALNSNSYGYDDLDRLATTTLPGNSSYAYSYDLTGNRVGKSYGGGGGDTYSISPTSNRIGQISGSVGRTFAYDANGSTTNDGNNLYTYDPRGRMVQAQGAAGVTTYQVGANGQRVRKTSALVGDTLFIYDSGGKLITEATPAGQVKKEYFYLLDFPVAAFVQQ